MTDTALDTSPARKTWWGVIAFYALIAFEFFYMASPFAAYFYSVYGPGLRFLNNSPVFAWLSGLFLPHIVSETRSPIINTHNVIGAALFGLGLIAFLAGAGQIYYHKLRKKGAVTGGIYNLIRHPQYAALAMAALGMLLLWPRYLALLLFVAVLFAYYFLAKIEERECERKFGQAYIEYKARTHMFLPFRIPSLSQWLRLPASGISRVGAILGSYLVLSGLAVLAANGLRSWTLNSLYAVYREDAAFVSVVRIDDEQLRRVIQIAENDPRVASMRNSANGSSSKEINYVLPTAWFVSEIPMASAGGHHAHLRSSSHENDQFKIVFTRAMLRYNPSATGKEILLQAKQRQPIAEVWVDSKQGLITDIKEPPTTTMYPNIPVPLF